MEKEQDDSKQPQTPVGEWVEQDDGEKVMLTTPQKINDPNCKHQWQYIFTDSEGFENFRCQKCPFGRRNKEDK